MLRFARFFSIVALFWAGTAIAQDTPPSPPAAASAKGPGQDIVVEGQRNEIRESIRQLLQQDSAQLARFEEDFCPIVIGFPADWSAIIETMIRENAAAAGLEVEDKPCSPTAVLIFSYDPEILMPALRTRYPAMFSGMNPVELDRLVNVERPAYSWRTVDMRDRFGLALPTLGAIGGSPADAKVVRNAAPTRLYSNVRLDILQSFLVIDIERTPGMTLDQLADFATLNLLLDLKENAEATAQQDSILNLFDGGDPALLPAGMNEFERRLIKGLYGQRHNNYSAARQIGRIATEMKKEPAKVAD